MTSNDLYNHSTNKKKPKVLVTGATGFIGNYVVEALLARGAEVVAASLNEADGKARSWYSKVKNVSFEIKADRGTDLYRFFEEPDILIHLAWGGLPNYKSAIHLADNLPHHSAFIENMVQNGLKDLTVTGTCFEYGMQEGCLSEDMAAEPDNSYATAKNELRKYIERLQDTYSFSFKWARLFYMYGQGQSPNSLLPQLDKAIENGQEVFNMSGGEQIRDFLPVEKVAEGIVKVALQRNVDGIINICSNLPVSVKQFVQDYLKRNHKQIKLNLGFYPYPDYEPMRFWGDNSKFKKIDNNA